MPAITLTIHQLYDRVWSEPIHRISKEFGLSDRGLGKLCAYHKIPVPERGYWRRKETGHNPRQSPLPVSVNPQQRLRFDVPDDQSSVSESAAPLHPLIAFEQQKENHITVPEQVELADPLVLKTQKSLTRSKRETSGLTAVPPGALHVHTSRAQHERALRIIQVLLTAVQSRGFSVAASANGVTVSILDESIGFGIEEQTKKVPHRISFTEQKLIDRGMSWQVPKFDEEPSGYLTLMITNMRGVRQRWSEKPQKPIEGRLNRFIIGLIRAALGLKEQRAEAARRERERQEAERKRQEEAQHLAEAELRWREEQGRVERLERLGAIRTRNLQLRELVAAIREAVGEVNAESETGRWLAWAENYANRSDPLNRFRNKSGATISLYYYGYDHDHIAERSFSEPPTSSYGTEKTKAGVELTDRPPRVTAWEKALKLELPEDLVHPYEWPQESNDYWRIFRVPARLLNSLLGLSQRGEASSDREDFNHGP